ncbi:MAG TPA: allophanate hydrolase [Burkholderiales bacterium]|nr:allophanate hydrolase [Burkholderiales bacterium]
MPPPYSLGLMSLARAYASRGLTPARVVDHVLAEIARSAAANPAWIHVFAREALLERAAEIGRARARGERLPLYGVPFAVKDNIDVAREPTTAACPAFRYVARETAEVVKRLETAGAICIGKTNMDQFATGLVGTRSPYGACVNPYDARYIAGGSSSGSAVAVALGQVSFALGTDTAGSGRVPAGFCNIVGVKPTRALVGTRGVVPACRSLDCVSIFAQTVEDATAVLATAGSVRPEHVEGRTALRCGVPSQLEFFGDAHAERAFDRALETLRSIGGDVVEVDFEPFLATARLLYEGPWVAERLAAIRSFFDKSSADMDPVVRQIIGGGARFSAVDVFEAQAELERLAGVCARVWDGVDALFVPTTGTIYRIDEVRADPIRLNSNLGYYTNFVNLLDLAAIAVPATFRDDGLPFGVTFIAPAFEDALLAQWGSRFSARAASRASATRA